MLLLAITSHVTAQVERTLPNKKASTLEGTSFVVGFMQNEISELPDERVLKVFISSQYDANIQLEYATGAITNIVVRANDVAVIDLPTIYMMYESEIARKRALFITSDVPVVVYALNSIALSTDSYTAIPVKALGREYYTVNRPNDQYLPSNDPNGNDFNIAVRQSEFMIVAVEDGTDVEITPAFVTENGLPKGQTRNVTLRRGDCYLVKSYELPIGMGDLTGSHIVSSKPIAVLSGAVRSGIPVTQSTSKDHLVEMLPPVASWGKTYAAIPFAMISRFAGNKVRLVSAADNTTISIQSVAGRNERLLSKAGDWIEVDLWDPTVYQSDQPFLAVQFMPSRQFNPLIPSSQNGDPAMVVLPAVDQYLSSTMFRFPELLAQSLLPSQDFYYFVTIIAESAAVATLKVNGSLVASLDPNFTTQVVSGTNLHWSNLQLPMGMYTISADSGLFGGTMYGLSQADSYANLFGATYDQSAKTTTDRPSYAMNIDCGIVTGAVSAIPLPSGKLSEVVVQASRCNNYQWEVVGPTDTNGTTDIRAWVKDLWRDAVFVVHAYDTSGAGREWLYEYVAPNVECPSTIQINGTQNGSHCRSIPVANKTRKPLHIKRIHLTGDPEISIVTREVTDTMLVPGDTIWVRVCLEEATPNATATLHIELDCDLDKTVLVNGQWAGAFSALGIDLGAVRIGDTACGRAPIISLGGGSLVITSLKMFADLDDFIVDTAAMKLPYTLASGDTLWIPICFTPKEERQYTRKDTVVSNLAGSVVVLFRGRGVRPRIPSVVINWNSRRVGSKNDTTFLLSNTGSGRAKLDTLLSDTWDSSFVISGPPFPLDLAEVSSQACTASFKPMMERGYADTVFVRVDWKLHEPVWIAFSGRGTIPAVITHDVNMGDVVVGTTKDTIVLVLESRGSEALTVLTRADNGADIGSFSVGTGLTAPSTIDTNTSITIPVSFTPNREGLHSMQVVLTHDAAPYGVTATSTISIVGNGVSAPHVQLESGLLAPSMVNACVADSASLTLTNAGNTVITIDSVEITLDGVNVPVVLPFPQTMQAATDITIPFNLLLGSVGVALLNATINYNKTETVIESQTITIHQLKPDLTLSVPPTVEAGEHVVANITVSQKQLMSIQQNVSLAVLFEASQWSPSLQPVQVIVTDVTGNWTETIAPFPISDGLRITLNRPVTAPFTVTSNVVGTALLNASGGVHLTILAEENACSDSAVVTGLSTMDVCGKALRQVRVGLPTTATSIGRNPTTSTLHVRFEATGQTTVYVDIVDAVSGIIAQNETVKLEKGDQYCNFSVKSLASGLYNLVVRDCCGEQVIPVVIIN